MSLIPIASASGLPSVDCLRLFFLLLPFPMAAPDQDFVSFPKAFISLRVFLRFCFSRRLQVVFFSRVHLAHMRVPGSQAGPLLLREHVSLFSRFALVFTCQLRLLDSLASLVPSERRWLFGNGRAKPAKGIGNFSNCLTEVVYGQMLNLGNSDRRPRRVASPHHSRSQAPTKTHPRNPNPPSVDVRPLATLASQAAA